MRTEHHVMTINDFVTLLNVPDTYVTYNTARRMDEEEWELGIQPCSSAWWELRVHKITLPSGLEYYRIHEYLAGSFATDEVHKSLASVLSRIRELLCLKKAPSTRFDIRDWGLLVLPEGYVLDPAHKDYMDGFTGRECLTLWRNRTDVVAQFIIYPQQEEFDVLVHWRYNPHCWDYLGLSLTKFQHQVRRMIVVDNRFSRA